MKKIDREDQSSQIWSENPKKCEESNKHINKKNGENILVNNLNMYDMDVPKKWKKMIK